MIDPVQHAIDTLDPDMSRHEIVKLREDLIKSKSEPTYLDNLLVQQKDRLIRRIDNARNLDDLKMVKHTLKLLQPLWAVCSYDYKERELQQRIRRKWETFK